MQGRRQFFDRLTLTLGTEYRNNLHQEQMNFDVAPYALYVMYQRSSYNVGVYGQAEFTILTNLLLSAGLRYDYYETFGDTVNPRLGLIYTPWAGSTFKALYGQAFRAPNAYELYYESVQFRGNLDLSAEQISTYELVYEQSRPRDFRFVLAGYYYRIDDLISQEAEPGLTHSIPPMTCSSSTTWTRSMRTASSSDRSANIREASWDAQAMRCSRRTMPTPAVN